MSDLITLPRKSAEFESYLRGSFSKELRALPLQTLNVNSPTEAVTFQILPLSAINRPGLLSRLLVIFKVRSFLWVLLPMFVVLAKNIDLGTVVDPWVVAFATVGVLFALMAMNLRNEYFDHMKGADRVLPESGTGAIQKGWVTAAEVQAYSIMWLVLALAMAALVTFAYAKVVLVALVAFNLGVWAQFQKSASFKYHIGGELSFYILIGPLLTIGYQLSMGRDWDSESMAIGAVWGLFVLFLHHVRNFLNILSSTQAGFSNTINWLGFDRSRRLLAGWWYFAVIACSAYQHFYGGFKKGLLTFAILVVAGIPFVQNLKKLSSPVGGQIRRVYRQGYFLFLLATGLWFLESLWLIIR